MLGKSQLSNATDADKISARGLRVALGGSLTLNVQNLLL